MKLTPMECVVIVKRLRPAAAGVTLVRSLTGVRAWLAVRYAEGWKDAPAEQIARVFPGVPSQFPAMIWQEREQLPDAMSCPGSMMVVRSWEGLL